MLGPHTSAERAAYEYLREQILSGAVTGGTPILQQEVADQLGFSRIPVRDAIKHLSAEGLVTIESNRRVIVTQMTLADVREVFFMRAALEGLAARAAAEKLSDAVLARLAVLVERMEPAETDPTDWLRIHDEFHGMLIAQSGMPRLQREIDRLRSAIEPYIRVFLATHGMGELKGSKHRELLAALKRRDGEHAERAVREHIEQAFGEIWAVIHSAKEAKQVQRPPKRRRH
jgi:DNA-binding GntR family transcriptional regulator